jgi:hypothetical protein
MKTSRVLLLLIVICSPPEPATLVPRAVWLQQGPIPGRIVQDTRTTSPSSAFDTPIGPAHPPISAAHMGVQSCRD